MDIASISIKRPVLASVLSIMLLLFGFVGFKMLGLREFPSVDPPIVTVSTSYTGANADVMATQITQILEESINGIAGIRTLSSSSSDGSSRITVEFNIDADMEAAANDVWDRVSRVLNRLPQDCDPPVVVKTDADAILVLTVQGNARSLLELTDYGINVFKERLQTIPGVSDIRIYGEKKYAMRLELDPARLTAFQISPTDIRTALQREDVELPSGRIEGYERELTIRTLGRLTTEEELNNLLIKEQNRVLIRLTHAPQYPQVAFFTDYTYNEYKNDLKLVTIETANLVVARHTAKISFEKFRIGGMSDYELRQIQLSELEAENSLLTAQFQAKKSETELLRLSGKLIEDKKSK